MKKRTHPRIVELALLSLLVVGIPLLSAACAPASEISLTLTMLPGTFTPIPPTPWPTSTLRRTGTPDPRIVATSTQLPGTAEACPPFQLDPSAPSNSDPQAFIGKHFDDQNLPAGMKRLNSSFLGSDVYTYTKNSLRGQVLFLVQKLACRDTAGRAYYEVSDALILPRMDAAGHEVETQVCFEGSPSAAKTPLPDVLAYGTYDPARPVFQAAGFTGWEMQVKRAWQMKQRFVPLEPANLTCLVVQK